MCRAGMMQKLLSGLIFEGIFRRKSARHYGLNRVEGAWLWGLGGIKFASLPGSDALKKRHGRSQASMSAHDRAMEAKS